MIKTLDRYLLRSFFQALFVVTVSLTLMIIIINMVEQLRDFLDHDVSFLKILEYYLYWGGWVIKTFFPMFVLLSILFSVSMMARKNEILAMKANGLSLYRIALPFVMVTLLLAGGHFWYNEYFFPPANRKRVEMKTFVIEARSAQILQRASNVYRQIRPGYFYTIGRFNVSQNSGTTFRLYHSESNQLKRLVVANEIIYEDFIWKAISGESRIFEDGINVSFVTFDTLELTDIKDKPKDFARKIGKSEDMSLDEITQYIELMKRTGGPYLRELVDLKIKYSYPLTSCIIVLICVPLAANPRRGGVAVSFAMGTLISLIYFVLFRMSQAAAYSEKIPVEVGVWGIDALFLLVGIVLMVKAKK